MSTAEKLLSRMRANPRDWKIEDIVTVARRYGMLIRTTGGSHYMFGYPGVKESVSIPAHRPIKPVYVTKFIEFVDMVREVNDESQI